MHHVSIALRKRFTEAGVAAELARQRAEFKPAFALPAECCREYRDELDYLEGRKPTTTDEYLISQTPAHKKFYRGFVRCLGGFLQAAHRGQLRADVRSRAGQAAAHLPDRAALIQPEFPLDKRPHPPAQRLGCRPGEGHWRLLRVHRPVPFRGRREGWREGRWQGKPDWKYVARREISNPKGALSRAFPAG